MRVCMRPYGEVCVCVCVCVCVSGLLASSHARSDRERRTRTLAPKSPDPPESRRRHPNAGCASGCPRNQKMALLALRLGPLRVIFLRRSCRARAAPLGLRTQGTALLLRCAVGIPDKCQDLRRAKAPILFSGGSGCPALENVCGLCQPFAARPRWCSCWEPSTRRDIEAKIATGSEQRSGSAPPPG